MDNGKLLVKNSIFNIIYRVLNMLFPLITSAYVARVLKAESIGLVSAAQNMASYFTLLAGMGIPIYGTKIIAQVKKDTDEFNKRFSELFIINMWLSFAAAILYYNLIYFIPYFEKRRLIYSLTGIPLLLNILNVDWVYQGIQEYVYITVRSFIVKCFSLIMLFVFVKTSNDYIMYALISLIAQAGNYFFNIYRLRKLVKITLVNLEFKIHLSHILTLFMASLASEIYVLADITMLDMMTNSKSVGFYTMGSRIISIFKGVVTAITAVFLPQLSAYYYKNIKYKFIDLINRGLQILLIFAIPVTVGIILCVDDAIMLIYGSNFSPSIIVTQILSISVISVAISNFLGLQVFVILGKEKITTLSTVIGASINICLNYYFIDKMGMIGAAIVSVISEVSVTMIQVISVRRYIDLKVSIKKSVYAVIIMSIIVLFIHSIPIHNIVRLFLEIGFGVLVYLTSLILMRDDFAIKAVTSIMQKIKKKR